MAERFQHEDVAAVPRGYRVRTIRRGEHEIRVAFPPGRRRRGAGRVVSILHPLGENPGCPIRNIAAQLANPEPCKCGSGEPAVFGGMCARCARVKAKEARERAAKIRAAAFNGKKKNPKGPSNVYSKAVSLGYPFLRGEGRVSRDGETWLSRVTKKADGSGPAIFVGWNASTRKWVIERDDSNPVRMRVFFDPGIKKYTAVIYDPKFGNLYASGHTKKQAAKALHERVREYHRSGRLPAGGGYGNPRRRNPDGELDQAAELYREFHGREPHEILEFQESELARKDYTALGDAIVLRFILPDERILVISFTESDKVLVVSSPDGRQLYLLGGNQDIAGALAEYNVDTSKDLIDLGDAVFISYDASKWQTDFKPTIWEHKLGEESGIHPRGFFDNRPAPPGERKGRIFFAGGNYRIERPGIID